MVFSIVSIKDDMQFTTSILVRIGVKWFDDYHKRKMVITRRWNITCVSNEDIYF